MLAVLVAFVAIFTRWGLAAAIVFWSLLMLGLVTWSLNQQRRARREIRSQIARSGYKVLKMNYRHLRLGPFSLWNSSRSQLVYRVVVQEATGRERVVWARWGRKWFWNPDALELKWEE